jgi:hypothetical protein
VARRTPPDAVLRFTRSEALSPQMQRAFGSSRLADHLPPGMNVQFASGFFRQRDTERRR